MSARSFSRDLKLNNADSMLQHQMASAIAEQSRYEQKNVNLRSSASSSKFVAKSVSGANSAAINAATSNRGSNPTMERIGLTNQNRTSCPSSPIVDEPFSPSTTSNTNGFFSQSGLGSSGLGGAFGNKHHFAHFNNSNSQRLNNAASNLKQMTYSISSASGNSSGTQLNCAFGNAAKHAFGSRTGGLTIRQSSLDPDPLDFQFRTLCLAARSACPEEAGGAAGGSAANQEVSSAFSKIAARMTDLAQRYKELTVPTRTTPSPTNVNYQSGDLSADSADECGFESMQPSPTSSTDRQLAILSSMQQLLRRSWAVPFYGKELNRNLATVLRNLGILEVLLQTFGNSNTGNTEKSTVEDLVDGPTAGEIETDTEDKEAIASAVIVNGGELGCATTNSSKESLLGSREALDKTDEILTGSELNGKSMIKESIIAQRKSSFDRTAEASAVVAANAAKDQLRLASARLLSECMTSENRTYLVDVCSSRLRDLVRYCNEQARARLNPERERVAMGVLRPLLEHGEESCRQVLLRLGAMDALLYECRTADIHTLQYCVHCLANVCLFGGEECQQQLVSQNLLIWLFPLASHRDPEVKYYALLTLAILVANKEMESHVVKSGSLELIQTFVLISDPQEFARIKDNSVNNNGFGQSKEWLRKLVSVLDCDREEAKSIAAFHFAMEAQLKKRLGNIVLFKEIHAIASLKKVASSPIAIASKFAAHALKILGESVPHKLSQQVALWAIDDVKEWITQIDFADFADRFVASKVDGDLLLRLNETHLAEDVGMANGLLRMRFMRELTHLKILAEYSNCDNSNVAKVLNSISEDYNQYTYSLINCGLDTRTLQTCSKEQLRDFCGIYNEIHAENIVNAFKNNMFSDEIKQLGSLESIDAFISYRRVGGSQLASLLKVHLTLKGLKVFLDVEKLQAGKFHHNLLTSIKQARHFILVLTPHSLDRCIDDHECSDWVHKEIVEALGCKCNIIPIIFDFEWPNIDKLPEDMRSIIQFNAVTWSHEYQEACVDKLLRFMQEEERLRKYPSSVGASNTSGLNSTGSYLPHGQGPPPSSATFGHLNRYGSNPQLSGHIAPSGLPPSPLPPSLIGKPPPITYSRSNTMSPVPQ